MIRPNPSANFLLFVVVVLASIVDFLAREVDVQLQMVLRPFLYGIIIWFFAKGIAAAIRRVQQEVATPPESTLTLKCQRPIRRPPAN